MIDERVLLEKIESRLDAMISAPRMFGSSESLEAQFVLLLEFKSMLMSPESDGGELIDAYHAFIAESFPEAGPIPLAFILRGPEKLGELTACLQRLRERVGRGRGRE